MALFLQSNANFVIAERACTSLIYTSFTDVPSVVCVDPQVCEIAHFVSSIKSIKAFITPCGA